MVRKISILIVVLTFLLGCSSQPVNAPAAAVEPLTGLIVSILAPGLAQASPYFAVRSELIDAKNLDEGVSVRKGDVIACWILKAAQLDSCSPGDLFLPENSSIERIFFAVAAQDDDSALILVDYHPRLITMEERDTLGRENIQGYRVVAIYDDGTGKVKSKTRMGIWTAP